MSTLKADTIQNTSGGAATLTKQHAAKHFVIYDNTDSSRAIQNSLNCSSLSDVGTGQTSVSYANNFSNTKYTHGGAAAWDGGDIVSAALQNAATKTSDITTSAIELSTRYVTASSAGVYDYDYSQNTSLGDLA
tara:strand:+ start:16533 stop:16931 length:399 start_codon:yes stop_codon:yes gene_type:complete